MNKEFTIAMLEKNWGEEVQPVAFAWSTNKYGMFKRLENNRIVTEARVKKLLASFGEKAIDTPIICNEKMEVIDGQGRFETRKRLGLPIPFIIIPDLNEDDCSRLNKYNTKWEIEDWVNSWAKNENKEIANNYILFKETVKEVGLSVSMVAFIGARTKNSKGNRTDAIIAGGLIFTEESKKFVVEVVNNGNDILDALCCVKRPNAAFWNSVKVITSNDKYNHKRMISKCQICRSSYAQMANLENQLKEFTRIYNYKAKTKDEKLFFEDYMRNKGSNVIDYTERMMQKDKSDISTLT